MTEAFLMASDSSIPQATQDYLDKLSEHVDDRPVLYATKFMRPDEKLKGTSTGAVARFAVDAAFKAASRAIASGIPTDGWLIATPAGIHVFKKTVLGAVGNPVGTLTSDVIASVSVAHGKRATRTQISVTMIDHSSATVLVRTGETYPALSPWIRGASACEDPGLAQCMPAVPDALGFDTELLRSLPVADPARSVV